MEYQIILNLQNKFYKMNNSYPASKPVFQTPSKVEKNNHQYVGYSSKLPPTTTQVNKNNTGAQQIGSRQIGKFRPSNSRVHDKTNMPYLNSSPIPSVYHHQGDYANYSEPQLINIIYQYQQQIAILKEYIHTSELLERKRIIQIFGFDYPCCGPKAAQQSKIVLKQLTIKIKHLIRENNALKQQQGEPKTAKRSQNDQMLMKQNQRLRMIINQYKTTQDQDLANAKKQLYRLDKQNKELHELINKYKNKIDILQNDMKKKIDSSIANKNQNNFIINQISPIRQPYNSNKSTEQIQYAKRQVTKQLFEFQQEQKNQINQYKQKISQLQKRLRLLEQKVKQYEKQRNYKIDSTMRKSYALSQNVPKPRGQILIEENEPENQDEIIRQQGKIRFTKFFGNRIEHIPSTNTNPSTAINELNKLPIQNNTSQMNSAEIKILNDNLAMQKLKNKNLNQENHMLKKKLGQAENQLQERIQRNIKLQYIISELQKQKANEIKKPAEDRKTTQNIQQDLKDIISTLKECNVDNFNIFFQEFNQILEQRKILNKAIQEYKSANQVINKKKSKQQQQKQKSILIQKINQLIDQNNRLIKKIAELQNQVQEYHQEIIKNQIQKLNSINLNQDMKPSGQEALYFQRIVRNSIQQALTKLENLNSRISNSQVNKSIKRTAVNQKQRDAQKPNLN